MKMSVPQRRGSALLDLLLPVRSRQLPGVFPCPFIHLIDKALKRIGNKFLLVVNQVKFSLDGLVRDRDGCQLTIYNFFFGNFSTYQSNAQAIFNSQFDGPIAREFQGRGYGYVISFDEGMENLVWR